MLEAMSNIINDFPLDIYSSTGIPTSRKNNWHIDKDNLCTKVHLNYADQCNLEKAKQPCQLTLSSVKEYLKLKEEPSISECLWLIV